MSQAFYDELSPFYHLIFADWEASIERQAVILDQLIRQEWGADANAILDVSAGIGTQTLGLAQRGYTLSASDLSPKAIDRARREAEKRGLDIAFSVADMRQAHKHHALPFDVVISCDNAVPHLLSDADIREAFRVFYHCLRPGGGCIITVRDYAQEKRGGVEVKPYGVRQAKGRRYLVFQVWEWDGDQYEVSMYMVEDAGGAQGVTHIFRTWYYAISVARLIELLEEVGFRDVRRAEAGYYQPVLVGTKKRKT